VTFGNTSNKTTGRRLEVILQPGGPVRKGPGSAETRVPRAPPARGTSPAASASDQTAPPLPRGFLGGRGHRGLAAWVWSDPIRYGVKPRTATDSGGKAVNGKVAGRRATRAGPSLRRKVR